MARVFPLRHRRNRRQHVRWRTPFSELLEPRIVLAAGQWIAVINSMAPADNLEEQARLAQDLLAASDVEQQEARVGRSSN